jgi:hypothetical protein
VSPFLVTADSFFFASWRGLGDAMPHPKCGFQAGYTLLGIRTNGINTNMFKWISGGVYPPRNPYQRYTNKYVQHGLQAGHTLLEIRTSRTLVIYIKRGIPPSKSIPEALDIACSKWISGGVYPPRYPLQKHKTQRAPNGYQAGYTLFEICTRGRASCCYPPRIRTGSCPQIHLISQSPF